MELGIAVGVFFGLALVTGMIMSSMSAKRMRTNEVRERED